MRRGICVTATTNVMKNNKMRKGKIVLHEELQGPAVATGTTVTSPISDVKGAVTELRFPWMPANIPLITKHYYPKS